MTEAPGPIPDALQAAKSGSPTYRTNGVVTIPGGMKGALRPRPRKASLLVAGIACALLVFMAYVVVSSWARALGLRAGAEAAQRTEQVFDVVFREGLEARLSDPSARVTGDLDRDLAPWLQQPALGLEGVEVLDASGATVYEAGRVGRATATRARKGLVRAREGAELLPAERGMPSVFEVFAPPAGDEDASSGLVARFLWDAETLGADALETARGVYLIPALLLLFLTAAGAGLVVALVLTSAGRVRRAAVRREMRAHHDDLTRLPNRGLFRARARRALAQAGRDGDEAALLVMDLDRFKEINDTLGHGHGDLMLQAIAGRVRNTVRAVDIVARLGGDEFAVLLPNVAGPDAALRVAKNVLLAVRQPLRLNNLTLTVGTSIGIALYPAHGRELGTLLKHADVAMYTAKAGGTGCELYTPHTGDGRSRVALLHDLEGAISRGEMRLSYQPQIEIATGIVSGAEVLVRWQHPGRGVIVPAEFLPMIESSGLSGELTEWVLDAALSRAAAWRRDGVDVVVCVNVSLRGLSDGRLLTDVARLLDKWGVPRVGLEVELAEPAILAEQRRAAALIEALRELGVGVAIHNFGTGHSSMTLLRKLPFTTVKIDRSLVVGMRSSRSDLAIVRSTVDMAATLGLRAVAEGVENEETWNLLESLGCDVAQGYRKARPMADDQIPWLVGLLTGTPTPG